MKKTLLTLGLAIGLMALANPAMAYWPQAGDLVKTANNPAIYYIGQDGTRHSLVSANVFWTWYNGSWKDQSIQTISQYDMDNIRYGKNITARAGTKLIKFSGSEIVYAVGPNRKLCYGASGWGNDWGKRVININNFFASDYALDKSCVINYYSQLPNGTLIKQKDSSEIYYLENGYRRWVSADGFRANNFRWENVVVVDDLYPFSAGRDLTYRESAVSQPDYYLY